MAVSRGKMLGGFTRGPGGRKCHCCQDPDTTRWRKNVERREVAQEIAEEIALTRHADHDPSLPCRPALGNGLCYPVPAGEQLVPWREVLSSDGGNR